MNKLNNHKKQEFNINSSHMLDKEIHKKHKEELGLNVPKDYFAKSKVDILEMVSKQKETKISIFSRERMVWFAAASIALIFAITVFKPNVFPSINEIPAIVSDTVDTFKNNGLALENLQGNENEALIASLFVDDTEVDEFVTDYVLEELVYEEVLNN